jgi:hypothetical protein
LKKYIRYLRAWVILLVLIIAITLTPSLASATTTCTLSLSASSQTVAPGGTFDITLSVNLSAASRSGQCGLNWDPVKLQCTSISTGTFYSSWASTHSATAMILPSNPIPIDNDTGNAVPGVALLGASTEGGPSGQGTVFIFHMVAKADVSGTTTVHTSNVEFSDAEANVITGITVQNDNLQITISSVSTNPTPSITSFSPTAGSQGTSVIITGSNLTGTTTVRFGGTAAQSYTVNSDTQITAVVGDGTSGTISITTGGGTATSSGSYIYIPTATTTSPTTTTSSTTTPTTTITPATTTPVVMTTPPTTTRTKSTSGKTTPMESQDAKEETKSTLSANEMDLSDIVDRGGLLQDDISDKVFYDTETTISLDITNGTRGLTRDGSPLQSISINKSTTINYPPPSGTYLVRSFDFEPNGSTFSPPIEVTLKYDPSQLASGVKENKLGLYYLDSEKGEWSKCDYVLDTDRHEIIASVSHFSVYGILSTTTPGIMGIRWNLTTLIIIIELVLGACVILFFLLRNRPVPVVSTGAVKGDTYKRSSISTSLGSSTEREIPVNTSISGQVSHDVWEDVLRKDMGQENLPVRAQLEIVGGRIIIPRDSKSVDIEILNMANSHVVVSLEYDSVKHLQGLARIVIKGESTIYDQSKE